MYFYVLFGLITYNYIEGDWMVNSKIDEFKLFVKANPFLISYIRDGKKSWQDFYEIYDMYGDDEEAWNKYLDNSSSDDRSSDNKNSNSNSNSNSSNNSFTGHLDDFIKMAKNVDVDKVQEGITSLQKTLALFGDLFVNKNNNNKGYSPRPLYRRFED